MNTPIRVGLMSIVLALGGCAMSSPIQQYGDSQSAFKKPPELISHNYPEQDIYRIYHRAATGYVSVATIRQSAEQRAEDFAFRQGKGLVVLGEQISKPPYILGNFPRIEIVFALIDTRPSEALAAGRDRYTDLERIKKLLDQGALTQDEFDWEKTKILNR